MRLVSYDTGWGFRAGLLVDGNVVDAQAVTEALGLAIREPRGVRQLLDAGVHELPEAEKHARAMGRANGPAVRAAHTVRLGPPVTDPDKIICLGLNYRDHAEEAGLALPPAPMLFAKFRNSLIGPADPIVLPRQSQAVDYEAELAVVVGRRCRDVDPCDAVGHLAGAMALNDVSARDLQNQTSQWMAGKAIDGFAPCGPALVTLDEVGDLQSLRLRTRRNGRVLRDASTALMIFDVATTVAHLSRLMTLEPGDIIATGTPAGVGFTRQPPELLADGDLIEVEVEGIGVLANPVVAADATAAAAAPAGEAVAAGN